MDAWVTGQRKDQSPGTRNVLAFAELDSAFSKDDKPLYKFNPLANWSSEDVWNYIKMFDVPYNELHAKGFTSIGCEPCTRPVLPNQHEREGRWWWEESENKGSAYILATSFLPRSSSSRDWSTTLAATFPNTERKFTQRDESASDPLIHLFCPHKIPFSH